MTQATVWKPQSELESNPIGLSKDAVTAIAPQLDQHVASLFTLTSSFVIASGLGRTTAWP